MHNRLELPYPIEEGLNEFLPPPALKVVAVEYQQGLLDRLNEEVAGTELAGKPVAQTVLQAGRDPSKSLAFNYASEALNNSFFLSCLRPIPSGQTSHEAHITPDFAHAIRHDFGGLDELKSTFSAAVQGMFSPGWVWLVVDTKGSLAVCPTFGHGSLLIRSSTFLTQKANPTHSTRVVGEEYPLEENRTFSPFARATSSPASGRENKQPWPPMEPLKGSRTYTSASRQSEQGSQHSAQTFYAKDVTRVGDQLYPLLCVSVHEHAWMSAGYGVWGKEEWMKKFWTVVHWQQASEYFTQYLRPMRH